MTIKLQGMLLKTLLVLFSFLFSFGCQNRTRETQKRTIKELSVNDSSFKEQEIDSIKFKNEVITFLLKEQELVKRNQIEKIANHIKFPLSGGYVLAQVYGDEFFRALEKDEAFTKTVDRAIFVKKYDSIYKPVFRYLLSEINIKKKMNDSLNNYKLTKEENKVLWTIDFESSFENKNLLIYWRVVTDSWEDEYTVFFRYKYESTSFTLIQIDVIG